MEQIPNWLSDAVAAAGMTAYADELYPKAGKEAVFVVDGLALAESASPLH